MRLVNRSQNRTVAERLAVPNGVWGRMRGLLGTAALDPDEGLMLLPCRWVHTFGMRYTIDVLFLDRHYRVVRCCPELRPNRFSPFVAGASITIELAAGSIERRGVQPGNQLAVES